MEFLSIWHRSKNGIFIYVVATGSESDKRRERRRFLLKKCREVGIAFGENFSPFNLNFLVIYILGCRRCLVAPDTIVHRPWTCLFDCLVIDCDIGLNVGCGVKKKSNR